MKEQKPYTMPKLKKGKLKWYIEYSYYDPKTSEMVRKRDYEGLNIKGTSDKAREKIADTNIIAIIKWLERIKPVLNEEKKAPNKTIKELIDDFIKIKEKTLRKKSLTHYTQGRRVFTEYGHTNLKPEQFTPAMAQGFSDFLITEKGYAPKSINNHLSYVTGFFQMMEDRDIIDKNPFRRVKKQIKGKGRIVFYNDKQKAEIKDYMIRNEHPLLLYVQFIFYCFIRPAELMELQVKHIDFENESILIPAHIAKNNKDGVVPIKKELFKQVKAKYKNLDPELYLFGKGLVPNPISVHRNRASTSHKLLLQDLKYSPEHHLYDWKHTGARNFILSGRNPFDLMRLMRHSSLEQTMHYLASLGVSIVLKPNPNAWTF